ncbi:MAG: hypothetical protein WCV85_00045 [Patescibacteria group bacterium]|jgi:hypothetical protein
MKKVIPFLFAGILLLGIYYLLINQNAFERENNNTQMTNETTQTVYENAIGKFFLTLPFGWKSEPLALATGGTIQQNESRVAFTTPKFSTKILLSLQFSVEKYSSTESYVRALLEKNRADVQRGDEPYVWEYESLEKLPSTIFDGHIMHRLKTPAGYVSHVYILHKDLLLDFMVYHETDQQIFDVDRTDIQISSGVINSLQWKQ